MWGGGNCTAGPAIVWFAQREVAIACPADLRVEGAGLSGVRPPPWLGHFYIEVPMNGVRAVAVVLHSLGRQPPPRGGTLRESIRAVSDKEGVLP